MAGGPSDDTKRASAETDRSYDITDGWGYIVANFLIVAVIAVTVWGLVTGIRHGIGFGSELIFSGFEQESTSAAPRVEPGVEPKLEHSAAQAPATHGENKAGAHAGGAFSGKGLAESLPVSAPILLVVVIIAGALLRGALLLLPSWKDSEGDGMGASLERFHATYENDQDGHQPRYDQPTFMAAIKRAVLTVLTVGTGGSGGIEAPVVPVGEAFGAGWSRVLKVVRPDDLRIYQMAGVAAAVATLLDAPFTAALFAAEVVYNARILYRTLMYSLISAVLAIVLNSNFAVTEPLFTGKAHGSFYSPLEYLEVALVALFISAPAGIGIMLLFKKLKSIIQPIPAFFRPTVGAIAVAAIGLGVWYGLGLDPRHVMGVSEETIAQVSSGEGSPPLKVWWVLVVLVIAKAVATGFTLMAGGSAGALVPSMYMGGLSGAAVYYFLVEMGLPVPHDPSLFVAAGLASALVAVVQVPLAAIAFVMEVFGASYGPPAIIACVLTYKMARRWRLYVEPNDDGEK
jgi:CIC family chloride channel protein